MPVVFRVQVTIKRAEIWRRQRGLPVIDTDNVVVARASGTGEVKCIDVRHQDVDVLKFTTSRGGGARVMPEREVRQRPHQEVAEVHFDET